MFLSTRNSAERDCQKLKINIDDTKTIDHFTCGDISCTENNSPVYLSMYYGVKCKICHKLLNSRAYLIPAEVGGQEGVFVPQTASVLITDDLQVVIPNIPSSVLALLKSSAPIDLEVI